MFTSIIHLAAVVYWIKNHTFSIVLKIIIAHLGLKVPPKCLCMKQFMWFSVINEVETFFLVAEQ